MTYELFGWLGLLLINGSRLPQLVHMLASKRAEGLSVAGTAAVEAGLLAYLAYAICIHDRVFIASNFIGVMGQGWVLWLNWKWRIRSEGVSNRVAAQPNHSESWQQIARGRSHSIR